MPISIKFFLSVCCLICKIEIVLLLQRAELLLMFLKIRSQNICENTWHRGGQWWSTCAAGFSSLLFSVLILCFLLERSICCSSFNYNWKLSIADPDPCVLDSWWISIAEGPTPLHDHLFLLLPSSHSFSCPLLSSPLLSSPYLLKKWLLERRWGACKAVISQWECLGTKYWLEGHLSGINPKTLFHPYNVRCSDRHDPLNTVANLCKSIKF